MFANGCASVCSGFGSAVNLPGLDLGGSMVGGAGAMKDPAAPQSRFKWMMEGSCSPDASSPENAFHKNGEILTFSHGEI